MTTSQIIEQYAERIATGDKPLWRIKNCEIEIHVVSRIVAKGEGKMSIGVFATSANDEYSAEQVHKVKLNLEPMAPDMSSVPATHDTPTFLRRIRKGAGESKRATRIANKTHEDALDIPTFMDGQKGKKRGFWKFLKKR